MYQCPREQTILSKTALVVRYLRYRACRSREIFYIGSVFPFISSVFPFIGSLVLYIGSLVGSEPIVVEGERCTLAVDRLHHGKIVRLGGQLRATKWCSRRLTWRRILYSHGDIGVLADGLQS